MATRTDSTVVIRFAHVRGMWEHVCRVCGAATYGEDYDLPTLSRAVRHAYTHGAAVHVDQSAVAAYRRANGG